MSGDWGEGVCAGCPETGTRVSLPWVWERPKRVGRKRSAGTLLGDGG